MGIFRQALDQSARPADADATPSGGLLDDDSAGASDKTAGLSKHERQQARMQERIAKLEAQNMAEKDWFMQGESAAGKKTTKGKGKFTLGNDHNRSLLRQQLRALLVSFEHLKSNICFGNNFECLNLNCLNHGVGNLMFQSASCSCLQLTAMLMCLWWGANTIMLSTTYTFAKACVTLFTISAEPFVNLIQLQKL